MIGPGPDRLEVQFLQLASHVLAYPLSDLFNLSFSTCTTPLSWKCTTVVPLYKSGDSQDINNHRPISIINNVPKVLEKLIYSQLSQYINNLNILSPYQSGFRPNFSTTSTLLKCCNDIFSSFDSNMSTGAFFY